MDLFSVVSRHVSWLEARHGITATNIANADTPGYRARAIAPFQLQEVATAGELKATHPAHFSEVYRQAENHEVRFQNNGDATHSGNDVIMERELRTLGENARNMTLDTSLAKIFHRMLIASVKG